MKITDQKTLSIIQIITTSLAIGVYVALGIGHYVDSVNDWYSWPYIAINLTRASLLFLPFIVTSVGIMQVVSIKGSGRPKIVMFTCISALFAFIPFTIIIPFIFNLIIVFKY